MAILTPTLLRSSGAHCRYFRGWGARAMLCACLALAAGWMTKSPVLTAEEPQASEQQVKAVFLINFPKYVDWPAEVFAETNSPIVIAVPGETKVAEEIQKIISGRAVNGREITLRRVPSGDTSGVCHIVFISAAEQQRSPNLLGKLKGGGVLTVGESDDFLESGGIINLARRDRRIALEVNLTAAENARLKISSKLLNVASVVKGKAK